MGLIDCRPHGDDMNYDKQIENILENFDFKKVHKVMKFLGRKWYDQELGYSVLPTKKKIKKEALRLLKSVVETKLDYNESGGLVASKYGDVLYLQFCVEEWEGE